MRASSFAGILAAVLLVITIILWVTGVEAGWLVPVTYAGGWFLGSAQTARILGE